MGASKRQFSTEDPRKSGGDTSIVERLDGMKDKGSLSIKYFAE
jgi:hypothetical protein